MTTESIECREGDVKGEYRLSGVLTFATAVAALKAAPLFRPGADLRFDLSGVVRADSAGVALLIEWLRRARAAGSHLRYAHAPESLRAMLRVGGVQDLLPIDMA
jgi:phospholipid transport system transporter-binding protein